MVLNHQTHMTNLLTRLGWQARIAAHADAKPGALPEHVRETARELVDYMLFVDEAPLPSAVKGASDFATGFPSKGPARQQRTIAARARPHAASDALSLQLHDLQRGVRRAAVRGKGARLRADVAGLVGRREQTGIMPGSSPADRRAIVEILRDTKIDLPEFFKAAQKP